MVLQDAFTLSQRIVSMIEDAMKLTRALIESTEAGHVAAFQHGRQTDESNGTSYLTRNFPLTLKVWRLPSCDYNANAPGTVFAKGVVLDTQC